jgi:hypothetical protein
MPKVSFLAPAVAAGMMLTLALSSPAAAFEVLKQTGTTGDYGTVGGPEGKCLYTGPSSPSGTTLKSIRVSPLAAGPATGNSQKVSFTVAIQKSTDNGSTWKTLKTGHTQTGTATNTTNPGFTAVTISFTGKLNVIYRATSTLKWLTNGNVSGLIKMRMQGYQLKIGKANGDVVQDDYCFGKLLD